MVRRSTYFLTLSLLAMSLAACETPTDVREPGPAIDMSLRVEFSHQVINSLEITSAEMRINEFRFEGETVHDNDVKIEVKDDIGMMVDLLSDTFDTDLTVSIPQGPYEEVEMRLESDSQGKIPSLTVEGNIIDSTQQQIPFRIEFNGEIKFKLEIEQEHDPFLFDGNLLGLFKFPAHFLEKIELIDPHLWQSLDLNEDGLLLINSEHNPELFRVLESDLDIDFKIEIER